MRIPLSRPDITGLERKAALEVLKTPYLSMGPKIKEFEKKIAGYVGRKYAVAVNSGTSALHLIIKALGIKEESEVITTPFSFISSSNCILYGRAKPVFVDINPETFNIDTLKIEEKITSKTKAILAVDVFGNPADWGRLEKIARKYKLYLIEDSAEALGSEYNNKKCGSFGEASIFGFFPNKQITTAGEGGVVLTDKKEIANFCRSSANQGRKENQGKWLEHIRLGYNYRMPEICAAVGLAQLKRINEILRKRKRTALLYNKKLKGVEGLEFFKNKGSWFVYIVVLDKKYNRDKIIKKMAEKGVACSNYFWPIHLQPFYKKKFGFKKGSFPIAENVSKRTLALPFYSGLKEKEIDFVVKTLKKLL